MSVSSIRVRARDKKEFDRLLKGLAIQTGSKLSQSELFHRVLEHAKRSKDAFVRRDEAYWRRFQFDLRRRTDAANETDGVVYGLDP